MAAVGLAGVCAAVVVALMSTLAGAEPPATTLISAAAAGGFSDGDSFLSGSARQVDSVGRYVVFSSVASDLAAAPDANGTYDIYLRDTLTAITQRVSVASDGGETDAGSYSPSVSVDGRYVAFASDATNLVADDTNGLTDVFVRDLTAGVTVRVSVNAAGVEATGGGSYSPAISADGHRIAFASDAPDLVGDDGNGVTDVFVRELVPDLSSGSTVRVSTSIAGGDADSASYSPNISGDGSTVGFVSDATNLVADDTDGVTDVFAVGLAPGSSIGRVSVAVGAEPDGPSFFSALSSDGRFVAFASLATNLVADDLNGLMDVFRFDRSGGTMARVSLSSSGGEADGGAYSPSISADGSIVVFASDATNLAAADGNFSTDVFARDVSAGTTVRVSRSTTGDDADGPSFNPVVSDDGAQVAFSSAASNLIPDGGSGHFDVFQSSRPAAVVSTPGIDLSASGTLVVPPAPLTQSSHALVTVTSTGTGDLHLSGFTVAGTAFALGTSPCATGTALGADGSCIADAGFSPPPCLAPSVLPPGASCTIDVSFKPVVAGPAAGMLTIASDAPTSPTMLGLFGNGLQPAAAGGGYVLLPGAPPKTKLIEQFRERFEFAFRMPRDGVVKGKRITYRYFSAGSFWVVRSLTVPRLLPGVDGGCPSESFGGPAEVRRLLPDGTELPPEPGAYWVKVDTTDCGSVPSSVPQSGVGFDKIAIELRAGGEFGAPVHTLGGTPGLRKPIASGSVGVRLVDIIAPPVPG